MDGFIEKYLQNSQGKFVISEIQYHMNGKCFKVIQGDMTIDFIENFNGATYQGQVKQLNGKKVPHGFGKSSKATGTYVGDFIMGVKVGKGSYFFPDGKLLEGTFVNNVAEGECTVTYPNGDVFTGLYLGGRRKKGIQTKLSGIRYEGEFNDQDYPHGTGKMTL